MPITAEQLTLRAEYRAPQAAPRPPRLSRSILNKVLGGRQALLVGDAQEVIDKILFEHELFRMDRFLMQFSVGSMPHAKMMRAIELYGTQVAPAVRRATGAG